MKRKILGLLAVGLLTGPIAAQAALVEFEYIASGTTVAHGSFSYANGASGTLGYGDLSSFSVTIGANTYTLAGIAGYNDYRWFAYDTAANTFLTNNNLCGFGGCGFSGSLAAINSTGTSGFFFNPAPGQFADYSAFSPTDFDTILLRRVSVVEPATLLLFGLALAGLGLTRGRRAHR
ncbi:MAG: hypothetical protein AB7P94_05105 [Steroidobacteraceae bacterium]